MRGVCDVLERCCGVVRCVVFVELDVRWGEVLEVCGICGTGCEVG